MLKSTNIMNDERKDYDAVLRKFDNFFHLRRNVIFERAQFNQRCQLPGESAEQYIIELYNLVEHRNYVDLKLEMIRDRLVVGILDKKLSEHLQLDPDLTLEVAKKKIHQLEAAGVRRSCIKQSGRGKTKPPLPHQKAREGEKSQYKHGRKNTNQNQQDFKSCSRCGKKTP